MRTSNWIAMPALLLAATTGAAASGMVPVPVPERVRGAEHVVVAKVTELQASYQQNEFGDQLIVSHVRLQVEETLKGRPEPSVEVDVLGGTVDGITLEVSSLPRMVRGERAVFFLTRDKRTDRLVPHLRGQGILKLDTQNRVKGSSLDLTTIRQMAASAAAR
jgi:hypothetical protein